MFIIVVSVVGYLVMINIYNVFIGTDMHSIDNCYDTVFI